MMSIHAANDSSEIASRPFGKVLSDVTVRSIDDIHVAAESLRNLAQEVGLQVCMTDDISSNEPMIDAEGTILAADVFGWVEDGERWWENRGIALHSPLARCARYESEPFWIDRRGAHLPWQNSYLAEMDWSEFSTLSIAKSAIIVPMHLPFAQIALAIFFPLKRETRNLSACFAEHGQMLATATRTFVAGYVQSMRKTRRIPSDCAITKREVECLRWAALGKTDREISMILERSHATVRYHIHRAGEKLDSVNRAQTIFKAGQLGYLGASD